MAVKQPKLPAGERIATVLFATSLASMTVSLIFIFLKFRKLNTMDLAERPDFIPMPALTDVAHNFEMALSGFRYGYLNSIVGAGIYLLIALFFVQIGRIILKALFSRSNQTVHILDTVSLAERVALFYIIGSLAGSLLWFGLGILGCLNSGLAWSLLWAGPILLAVESVRTKRSAGQGLKTLFEKVREGWSFFSSMEKVLASILLFVLILFFSSAVMLPQQFDTLFSQGGLPNFYVNEGRFVGIPTHSYSYLTQNMEMLLVWPLLLDSEFASKLIVTGFACPFFLLVWGFIKRHTSNLVALLTLFVLISAPALGHSLTYIKNDLPVSLFIYVQYWALIETFNRRLSALRVSQNWVLLAGILCGGAIGFKLVALPIAFFSSLAVLGTDLYFRIRRKEPGLLFPRWSLGLLAVSLP